MSNNPVEAEHGDIASTTTCNTCKNERLNADVLEVSDVLENGHPEEYNVCQFCLSTTSETKNEWLVDAAPLVGIAFTAGVVVSAISQLLTLNLFTTVVGFSVFAICFSTVYLFTHHGKYS
jgi:hypothetical protein